MREINNLIMQVRMLDHSELFHETDAGATEIAKKCLVARIDKARMKQKVHEEEKRPGVAGERGIWPLVRGCWSREGTHRAHASCSIL